MRRVLFAAAVGAIAASIAVLAHGDAPKDQYELFGPKTATIVDVKAGLEWERFPERDSDGGAQTTLLTQPQAAARCAANGYRLPTVKELLTIIDEDPHSVYADGATVLVMVDRNAFPTTEIDVPYWTSSPAGNEFWYVDFQNGLVNHAKGMQLNHARCVRVSVGDAGGN